MESIEDLDANIVDYINDDVDNTYSTFSDDNNHISTNDYDNAVFKIACSGYHSIPSKTNVNQPRQK